MSFNRLKYDRCNITKYNQESTGPGNYMTGTPIMCNTCFNDNPRIINQKESLPALLLRIITDPLLRNLM